MARLLRFSLPMSAVHCSTEGVVQAMLLGQTENLCGEYFFLFSNLGLAHILCASGLHMLLVAQLGRVSIYPLYCLFLTYAPKFRFSFSLYQVEAFFLFPLLTNYVYLAGWTKPLTRAYVAILFWSITRALGYSPNWLFFLLFTFSCSWFFGEGSLLSFSLSFFAVSSFCFAHIILRERSEGWLKKEWIYFLVLVLAPWLFTLPLVIWNFHQVSLISPVLNIFMGIPAILILVPGLLHAFCMQLSLETLGHFFDTIANTSVAFLITALQWIQTIPFIAIWVNPTFWLIAFLLLFGFFLYWREKKKPLFAFLICAFIVFRVFKDESNRAYILDVDQGDAILIQTKGSLPILIDVGPPGYGPYPALVSQELAGLSVATLSSVVLTHPDLDHVGGLASLFLRHKIEGDLWLQEQHLVYLKILSVLEEAERVQVPIRFFKNNRINRLHPSLHCIPLIMDTMPKANNSSTYCKFYMGEGKSLLLTGDSTTVLERKYMEQFPNFLKSTHLKVAHHGSKYSSSLEFLQWVDPRFAYISVGKWGRYGHPHKVLLQRLEREKISIFRTDREGRISVP